MQHTYEVAYAREFPETPLEEIANFDFAFFAFSDGVMHGEYTGVTSDIVPPKVSAGHYLTTSGYRELSDSVPSCMTLSLLRLRLSRPVCRMMSPPNTNVHYTLYTSVGKPGSKLSRL